MRRKRGHHFDFMEPPRGGLRKKRRIILDGASSNNSLESSLSSASNSMRQALEQLSSVNIEETSQPQVIFRNVESQIDVLRKLNRDFDSRIDFISRLWNGRKKTKTSTPIVLDLTSTDDGNDSDASNESDSDLQIVQPSAMVSPINFVPINIGSPSFDGNNNNINNKNNNFTQRTARSSSVDDADYLGSDNSDGDETSSPCEEHKYKNTRMEPFSSPEYIDLSSPPHQSSPVNSQTQSPISPLSSQTQSPISPLSSPPGSPENSPPSIPNSPRHEYDPSRSSSPGLVGVSPPRYSPPPLFRSGIINSNNSSSTSINRELRNPFENVNNSSLNDWDSISGRNLRTTNKPIAATTRNSNTISYPSTTNSRIIPRNVALHNRVSFSSSSLSSSSAAASSYSSNNNNIHNNPLVQNHNNPNTLLQSSSTRSPPTLDLLSDSVLSDDSEILNTILNNKNNTELNTGFDPYRSREHSTAGMTSYNERYIQRAPRPSQRNGHLNPQPAMASQQRTNNQGHYNDCGTKAPRTSWTGAAAYTEMSNNHYRMASNSPVITSDIPSNAPQNLNSGPPNSSVRRMRTLRPHSQAAPVLPTRNEFSKTPQQNSSSNTAQSRPERVVSRRQYEAMRRPPNRRFRQSSRGGRRRNAITLRCLPNQHFGRAATDIAALVQMLYGGRRNVTNVTVSTRPTGTPRSAVQCLPVEKIKETPIVGERRCVICLEDFKAGDMAKRLPCFHRFHVKEIDKWLSRKNSCPVCKTPVT